ncbi:IS701 family transposase [Oceanicoccus sp.]|uniref:IS701 family transposase n=1 Tax=Oceanicoccus sp. TaxID=2691044 RepID=UPI0026116098|nr:IS701 family transposase [Oceanicoccus sp.]
MSEFWQDFRPYVQTQTHDTSEYGLSYLGGLLRMKTKRNMANIGRNTAVKPQNMHHFMSNSPWSGPNLIAAIQDKVSNRAEFEAAMLIVDESADEKGGEWSAGAGRQHNGRLGKIEMSQVGVFLSLATPTANTWIDGELFIPEAWFEPEAADRRQKAEIPPERTFQTKPELVWPMIQRVWDKGLPFQAVAMDTLYGRSRKLRAQLDEAGIEYYADVPADTQVYLCQPHLVYPKTKRGKRSKRPKIATRPYEVRALCDSQHLRWQQITLRPSERGVLTAEFTCLPVWTLYNQTVRREWLLIRLDEKRITYTLSNAAWNTPLTTLAWRKSHRYFIERSNQDAKSELGWDEFQAIKYRAWQHQLALTILASWFITETQLDWAVRYQHDPHLLAQYEIDVLPVLSVANIRELLRAAMPLPQLSPIEAALLVIEHLDNRIRSRKSRLRNGPSP